MGCGASTPTEAEASSKGSGGPPIAQNKTPDQAPAQPVETPSEPKDAAAAPPAEPPTEPPADAPEAPAADAPAEPAADAPPADAAAPAPEGPKPPSRTQSLRLAPTTAAAPIRPSSAPLRV